VRLTLPAIATLAALIGACAPSQPRSGHVAEVRIDGRPTLPTDPALALQPWSTDAVEPSARHLELLGQIRDQGDGFFAATPPPAVLNEVELVFFLDGATAELADAYLRVVESEGEASALRPRLAWLYQRLGLETSALAQARISVDARPTDAQAWFILGFILGQGEDPSTETLAEIRDAFSMALHLDPAFEGPGGVTAATLRQQVERLNGVTR